MQKSFSQPVHLIEIKNSDMRKAYFSREAEKYLKN